MRPDVRLAAAALLLAACTTSPVAPVPQPLPETLAWAREGAGDGGAFLGLKTRENVGRSFDDLGSVEGIRVTRVVENSPAAEAGFEAGDVVLAFGEDATNDPGTLEALLIAGRVDEEVLVKVQRGDTVFSVPVTLRARATESTGEVEPLYVLDPARSRAGWLTGRGGVVLVSSDPSGPFARAGVPVGSTVRSIDGEDVHSDRALIRRLQVLDPGTEVDVVYDEPGTRDGQGPRQVRVKLLEQDRRITKVSFPILFGYRADASGKESYYSVLNLWLIWLYRYERTGEERRWSFFRFIRFESDVGELGE